MLSSSAYISNICIRAMYRRAKLLKTYLTCYFCTPINFLPHRRDQGRFVRSHQADWYLTPAEHDTATFESCGNSYLSTSQRIGLFSHLWRNALMAWYYTRFRVSWTCPFKSHVGYILKVDPNLETREVFFQISKVRFRNVIPTRHLKFCSRLPFFLRVNGLIHLLIR